MDKELNLQQFQSVVEKVVYRSDPHGHKTVAHRSALIDSHVFGLATPIRAFGCERFKKNCQKSVRT